MSITPFDNNLIRSGKALLTSLFIKVRSDFEDIEGRISDLEASIIQIPVGLIIAKGGSDVLPGYLFCDGSAVSRAEYPDLFAVIGVKFGPGNGTTTFNLPDFRGKTPIGAGHGPTLTTRTLGDSLGEENHVVTFGEMPSHTHGVTDPGHAHTHPFVHNNTGSSGSPYFWDNYASDFNASGTGSPVANAATGIVINNAGGGGSHNNIQPVLGCAFFIKI